MKIAVAHTWDGAAVSTAERVELDVSLTPAGLKLSVDAPFHGDPAPSAPPGTLDGLWAHEVVELFVAGEDAEDYTEIELGPHGHVLVLRLCGVRRRLATVLGHQPEVARVGERWVGRLVLPRHVLPARPARFNAFAIHGVGAQRRYLAHSPLPGPVPDFHQPERFPRLEGR